MNQTEVVLVVPKWQTQSWYNSFQGMLSQELCVVTPHVGNLYIPQEPEELHPFWLKLLLLIGKVSREVFLSQGCDKDTVEILMASWRKDTFSNYCLYMRKRFKFASFHQLNRQFRLHQLSLHYYSGRENPLIKFLWQEVHCHQ